MKSKKDDDAARRMMALFAGNESHYGTHGTPVLDDDNIKWGIKATAKTLRGTTTVEMWEKHLAGTKPLGVVPIRNDSTCTWASIDIDDYDADMLDIVKKVEASGLPLVPCRSKSGGLHLFLFIKEPADASVVQATLRSVAAGLGHASAEIFPKQTKLLVEKGDLGNWIVMPYFGSTYDGKLRWQHGLKKTGAEMTIEEFLSAAEKAAVSAADVSGIAAVGADKKSKKSDKDKAPFHDGPPCLSHLCALSTGIAQGGQNNAAFHMGVYFKRKHPEDWQRRLEEANQKFMRPPLPADNLAGVIRSLEKKDYQYKCKDQPMVQYCDPIRCRSRKFGVGAGGTYPQITAISLLETEPAVWFVQVEDARIAMSTAELRNYNRFSELCLEHVHKSFAVMSQQAWTGVLNDALTKLEKLETPPDIERGSQFRETLEQFLTNRQRGKEPDDVLQGRPWENEEEGRHYFQMRAFQKFMEREGLKEMAKSTGIVANRIRRLGGGDHQLNIRKGVNRRVWWVPSNMFEADPPAVVPKTEEGDL